MKWLLILIFLSVNGWAQKPMKATCNQKDLVRQDCRLRDGAYNIRLLSETVAWHDGTWHTVEEIPLKGKQSAWEKMRFDLMGGWPILQLWIWDQGVGEGQVQSLHWYTVSLVDRKFKILAEGIVRKRRPTAATESEKAGFLYDAWQKHGAKVLKNGEIEWTLIGTTKNLKRADYGL